MSSDEIKLMLEQIKMMLERLGHIETGIRNLGTRLEALETLVEERLQDTRPMWQGVQTQITELREHIDSDVSGLREEMAKGFRGVERKFEVLSKQFLDAQADQRDLHSEVEDIKKKVS